MGVKVVNPGGISAFKFNQRSLDLDEKHSHWGSTPRAIVHELALSLQELGVPHPLHIHASNLGVPGNIKSTIATLERLSKLYPKNSDIKLYLLSILLKMDSKVKVDFMVKTMLEDPNTNEETKKLIAELLTGDQFQNDKQSKWIAYLDINYSQTEEDNISGRTKSGQLAKSNGTTDSEVPFPANDSRLTLEYDKTFVRGTALTVGRILNESSSLFMNLGLNVNTFNQKLKGESDVHTVSLSYFKAKKNHYFSPYIYYNKLNYRMQEDYQAKGFGMSNTYLFNDKFNNMFKIRFN